MGVQKNNEEAAFGSPFSCQLKSLFTRQNIYAFINPERGKYENKHQRRVGALCALGRDVGGIHPHLGELKEREYVQINQQKAFR